MQEYTQKLVDGNILIFDKDYEYIENNTIFKMYQVTDGYSIILETIDDLDRNINMIINCIGEVYENVNGTFINFICVNERDDEIDFEMDEIEGHLRVYKQISV